MAMFAYHMLESTWALDDIRRRRLKVSRLGDMNDPFELLGAEQSTPAHRKLFGQFKRTISDEFGVLCFSRSCSSPLLWSHYADRHHGMCLMFAVDDAKAVSYTAKRLVAKIEHSLGEGTLSPDLFAQLLLTKYKEWEYENEVRIVVRLDEAQRDGDNYFVPFGPNLELRKVLLGARCSTTKADVREALAGLRPRPLTVQVRLAFKSFRVIPVNGPLLLARRLPAAVRARRI